MKLVECGTYEWQTQFLDIKNGVEIKIIKFYKYRFEI